MSIRSKIASISNKAKGIACKTKQSAIRLVGWFCRGYIATKLKNSVTISKNTFAEATHNGYISSGLVRISDKSLFAYISDIDGSDLVEEVKTYVSTLIKDYPDASPVIKLFTASGVLGMYARTDLTYVFIYGGIPFIVPVHRSLDGTDAIDASFSNSVNRVVSKLSSTNSNNVVSLGCVSQDVNITEYVLEYAKKSPLLNTTDIDISLVKMAIHDGTIQTYGSIYLPGGYLYDIYAIDALLSTTFRPYRDYSDSSHAPVPYDSAGREVILVGGEPDIVFLGTQVTLNGFLCDVWIPNDSRYYSIAKSIVDSKTLPLGSIVVDDEDYLESYAILIKMLTELDEENGSNDTDVAPNIMVNPEQEEFDDGDVPLLIDLPDLQ